MDGLTARESPSPLAGTLAGGVSTVLVGVRARTVCCYLTFRATPSCCMCYPNPSREPAPQVIMFKMCVLLFSPSASVYEISAAAIPPFCARCAV